MEKERGVGIDAKTGQADSNTVRQAPFWSYAFRPFFLLNGIFVVAVMALWVIVLHGAGPRGLPADTTAWHAHEMIVGFALAAVAGFALTAVATWTGRPPVRGRPLGLLVLAWLAGRIAMLFAGILPVAFVAPLDMAFPVLLCLVFGREVIGARNRRNYPIVALLALLAAGNFAYHVGPAWPALYLLIHGVLLLVTVIAGRIVPSFTANWLRARGQQRLPAVNPAVDRITLAVTAATGVAVALAPASNITGVLAFAASVAHGIRLARWRGLATTGEPLLFVLHVAYLWLPVGYALTGFAVFGWWFPPSAALHALTMGAIGGTILAVTTRVALGHTGRKLHAARATVAAYGILTVAVVIRVFGFLAGSAYLGLVDLAALGWMLTFAIFSWVYWPVLTGPRVE